MAYRTLLAIAASVHRDAVGASAPVRQIAFARFRFPDTFIQDRLVLIKPLDVYAIAGRPEPARIDANYPGPMAPLPRISHRMSRLTKNVGTRAPNSSQKRYMDRTLPGTHPN